MSSNAPAIERPTLESAELRSVFTTSLVEILHTCQISLVVSTYQAGKVILVRCDWDETAQRGVINTHFHNFLKPMGIAAQGNRLSIGGAKTVTELRNMPAVARKLEPQGKYDACYVPRAVHVTGDIDIHELAWGRALTNPRRDELWIVNTRFGCLCTLDIDHSFHPHWRPPFLSAYAPEDRCHLNGLALVNGLPQYVTALGETNTPAGWRSNKAAGGVLIDVATNQVLVRGLAMPHSPRWYNQQLYLLESGRGQLAVVDLAAAAKTCHLANNAMQVTRPLVQLPGFTRGLDFYGPLAFIGLSQVRESATFSGLPLIERLGETRTCGVWVVHLETKQTVGFLRFESGVQEIFAVQVLPGLRYPEILDWNDERMGFSYVLPDAALQETPNAEYQ